jgi:GxxExxY protein
MQRRFNLSRGPCGAIAWPISACFLGVSHEAYEGTKNRKEVRLELEKLATIAIDCGFRLHQEVGPGLLENAYEVLLAHMLTQRGVSVERQKNIPIVFDGVTVDRGFRIDLLLDGQLLIELKTVERLAPVHHKQVLTYLRFMGLPLGLLMNFSNETFKEGLRRILNRYDGPIDFAQKQP